MRIEARSLRSGSLPRSQPQGWLAGLALGIVFACVDTPTAFAGATCRPDYPDLACNCNYTCGFNGTCPAEECEDTPPICLAVVRQSWFWAVEHTYCTGPSGDIVVGPPGTATLTYAESSWLQFANVSNGVALVRWPLASGQNIDFGSLVPPFSRSLENMSLPADGWNGMPDVAYRCGAGLVPFQVAVKSFLAPVKECKAAIRSAAHCVTDSCQAGVVVDDSSLCSATPVLSDRNSTVAAISAAALLGACIWVVRRRRAAEPK